MKNIKNIILKIKKKIIYYDYLYRNLSYSEIPDYEYDKLINKFNILKKKYFFNEKKYLNKINYNYFNNNKIKKKKHLYPMLSLKHYYNINKIYYFYKKIYNIVKIKFNLCCELKIDGVSISLIYKKGNLIKAITKGNGYFGDDITTNILSINNIPLTLYGYNIPEKIDIRGEIFITYKNFNKITKKNDIYFLNTRNTTSGALRNINTKITSNKNLTFLCYDIGFIKPNLLNDSHFKNLKKVNKWGIPIHNFIKKFSKIENIKNFFLNSNINRKYFGFDNDGIVIKIDSKKLQNKVGYNNKYPKWAIAIKFKSQEKISKVINIIFNVSKYGIIIPIAIIKTVNILGNKINKITLHNKKNIETLNLYIGDFVIVKLLGDVIPQITKVILSKRNKKIKKIIFPKFCPSCKYKLKFIKNKNIYKCIENLSCKIQLEEKIKNFVSKKGFNITIIKKNIIHELIKKKIVKNILDIFKLNYKILLKLNKINKNILYRILISINKSKNIHLSNFIYSLGIKNIGRILSLNIAKHFKYLKNIIYADLKKLILVPKIKKKTAKNIFNFMKNKKNKIIISKIIKYINIYN
ncbi:DNA ligase [Candidatus Annandia adelgestsuga]|uniref:DNA ligase (NAD(+)) n=1 Tax=Candidatus Annandia adelgestsuga TaxID=1302411 RepID=A0A3Q9CLU2_9ENTR|nr:NAD-dependent DNA ligase LigA [Candidatus Annandia adelgestsuga]AZP36351.1 DNA ligase [Candidatus Annandia adelgestsuga]